MEMITDLFKDYPYLRGMVAAFTEGGFGRIDWIGHSMSGSNLGSNKPEDELPQAALGVLDYKFFAGDPASLDARLLVERLEKGDVVIVPGDDWKSLLERHFAGRLKPYPREAFQVSRLDPERLAKFRSWLLHPAFVLKQVKTIPEAARLASEVSRDLIKAGPGLGALALLQGLPCSGRSLWY